MDGLRLQRLRQVWSHVLCGVQFASLIVFLIHITAAAWENTPNEFYPPRCPVRSHLLGVKVFYGARVNVVNAP